LQISRQPNSLLLTYKALCWWPDASLFSSFS